MPNTTPDSIWYPDDSTAVDDLGGIFSTLATSVQNALDGIKTSLAPTPTSDTGWLLAGIQPATGWTGVADAEGNSTALKGGVRKVNNMVEHRWRITRSGGNLTANAQGNIGDVVVATITNTSLRPAGVVYGTFDFGPGVGTGGWRIEADGTVKIVDAYPNASIKTGNQIVLHTFYFTG